MDEKVFKIQQYYIGYPYNVSYHLDSIGFTDLDNNFTVTISMYLYKTNHDSVECRCSNMFIGNATYMVYPDTLDCMFIENDIADSFKEAMIEQSGGFVDAIYVSANLVIKLLQIIEEETGEKILSRFNGGNKMTKPNHGPFAIVGLYTMGRNKGDIRCIYDIHGNQCAPNEGIIGTYDTMEKAEEFLIACHYNALMALNMGMNTFEFIEKNAVLFNGTVPLNMHEIFNYINAVVTKDTTLGAYIGMLEDAGCINHISSSMAFQLTNADGTGIADEMPKNITTGYGFKIVTMDYLLKEFDSIKKGNLRGYMIIQE